jgi:hypothetical protein
MFMFIKLVLLATIVYADHFAPSLFGWDLDVAEYLLNAGPPDRLPTEHQDIPSACSSGGSVGYACPHMLMFSTDLILAARHDKLSEDFHYAVAAAQSDADCGKCYQLDLDLGSEPKRNQLIVQIVNSGNDVRPGQFDLHIGGGGLGLFNACSKDCQSRHCAGGPCAGVGMFEGTFDAWAPGGGCFSGGVRSTNTNNETTWNLCTSLSTSRGFRDRTLFQSCYLANVLGYHQNADKTRSVRVRCPAGLRAVTGLARTDDDGLPAASLSNDLPIVCQGGACATTYADCCKPSCSWAGKGAPQQQWPAAYVCNVFGLPV